MIFGLSLVSQTHFTLSFASIMPANTYLLLDVYIIRTCLD